MSMIQLSNGTQAFILNPRDLIDIAYNTLGIEYSNELEKVIQSATQDELYAEKRFNSDMNSYEDQIETYRDCMVEVLEIAEKLIDVLDDPKRLNRQEIFKEVMSITKKLNNIL